eukprot:gene13280-17793_t
MTKILNSFHKIAAICVTFLFVATNAATKATKKSSADAYDNRGNTPFFLQDPHDNMCLGPNGFTICDESALWILTRRPRKQTFSIVSLLHPNSNGHICLETKSYLFGWINSDIVGLGSCNRDVSKSWEFEFVDGSQVKLSNKGKCLVRGKKDYRNSVSVQACSKKEYLSLVYHPTAVHESGFNLKTADGKCFDGEKFRSCDGPQPTKLLWGIGIKFVGGQAMRYFYHYGIADRSGCIVSTNGDKKVGRGLCSTKAALNWALYGGQLAKNGKMCVTRKSDDSAVLAKCTVSSEFILMDIPTVQTTEQLAALLKNPNLSAEEKSALAETYQKRSLSA